MSDTVTLNILKFDPSIDAAPHFEEYSVPWQDDGATDIMNVLQCLSYINENIEAVAFDQNCGSGFCGRCGMMINGEPKLACWTKVEKGQTYTLEPLRNLPVVRDLVVDKRTNYKNYVETNLAVQTSQPITKLADIEYDFYYNTLHKFNMCRECMCCYAACPKVSNGFADAFIGPGAMMQIAMRNLDPIDEADRVWQAVFSGVFECDLCGKCGSVCPATIDIVGQINGLQKEAKKRGLSGSNGIIPASTYAAAETIAQTKASSSASGGSAGASASGGSVEEIVAASCVTDGCHSNADDILNYRTDAESAELRVDSHVSNQVELSDEQKEAFKTLFTE